MDPRPVQLADPTLGEQPAPATKTVLTSSHHHQPGGVPIQTMDQMQLRLITSQTGDQGILLMLPKPGLHQQARRFIDHQQPWILVTPWKRRLNP